MPRKVSDSVIVITGASCGIGRASATAFAQRGGTVVVAARRKDPLQELADECERLGGRALAVPTDVADESAVQNLARQAIENFGRIDTWVNNAAVTLFGRIEETPYEPYRRVIETNLFGFIHGARAAIPYFREQGQGVLINVSSVVGKIGQPYTSAYVASKFGIVGLSECLRQELLDVEDIHVCTILPGSTDTPLFQHAANYTGRTVKPLSPIDSPEHVARAIVRCAEQPRREVVVNAAGRMQLVFHTCAPGWAEQSLASKVERDHFQDQGAAPTAGNLFEPMPDWTSPTAGWQAQQPPLWPRAAGLAAAACGLGVAAWWLIASPSGQRVFSGVGRSWRGTRHGLFGLPGDGVVHTVGALGRKVLAPLAKK